MSDNEIPFTLKEYGDPRKEANWDLLPAPPGVCSQCARDHEPGMPHDRQSIRYQYSFYAEYGRLPTWEDAMAHCEESIQHGWRKALGANGVEEYQ